jgi:hypothetical protein
MGSPSQPLRESRQYDHGMASAHEIMQRMKEIQEVREKAFEPLAEILAKRSDLQRQLAELDEPYRQAFTAAEAAGWTADELKAIGAEEPAKRPKGRPRTRRATAKKTVSQAAAPGSPATPPTAAAPAQEGAGETVTATTAAVSG